MLIDEICNPQSALCNLLLAVFPRGEGFYFSPIKLGLVVVIYLMWVRTCWWVKMSRSVPEPCRQAQAQPASPLTWYVCGPRRSPVRSVT